MKILTFFIAGLFMTCSVNAQNDTALLRDRKTPANPSYCAVLKDGVTVVVMNDKPITSDVLLSNGTRISPDGAIVKRDGNRSDLQSGQCVDPSGKLISPTASTPGSSKKK